MSCFKVYSLVVGIYAPLSHFRIDSAESKVFLDAVDVRLAPVRGRVVLIERRVETNQKKSGLLLF